MTDISVPELVILDGEGGNVFTRGDRYEIPLYQRPYAWGERNIEQLVEDVRDLPDEGGQSYYLGSLVVWRKADGAYEVIDGQQRLTTLYLLLSALGERVGDADGAPSLAFSCRDRSRYTLRHLRDLDTAAKVDDGMLEANIARGYRLLEQTLTEMSADEHASLRRKLERTHLYRIEVPEHTDLNHYFEIMNTRGEQLEQHEILKAWLMEPLSGADSAKFSAIWDACSDMSGYVQMRFGMGAREAMFGWGFDQFPSHDRIARVRWGDGVRADSLGMREIVAERGDAASAELGGDDEPTRFESVIDFRFFLLHVLKVFVATQGIVATDPDDQLVPSLLDDKRLNATFEHVVAAGVWDGTPIDRARFSMAFVECLLQARYLFDRCIVKREYVGGDLDGRWSLKELQRTSKHGHHYRNSRFKMRWRERGTTSDRTSREVLMLESCLRVSYTSPKVMHWITRLLTELVRDPGMAGWHSFADAVEACARDAVREYVDAGEWSLGVNTPHVVLNYLDYLLWRRDRDRYRDFTFEFRTSVEHWYPQNPSDDTFVRWDEVDRLGNLCLVQRNVNSKFSNLNPIAKEATFKEMIAGGSLKLREMARLTAGVDDWKEGACQRHEAEMIALLRGACGGDSAVS